MCFRQEISLCDHDSASAAAFNPACWPQNFHRRTVRSRPCTKCESPVAVPTDRGSTKLCSAPLETSKGLGTDCSSDCESRRAPEGLQSHIRSNFFLPVSPRLSVRNCTDKATPCCSRYRTACHTPFRNRELTAVAYLYGNLLFLSAPNRHMPDPPPTSFRWKRLLPWLVLLVLAWGLRRTVSGALDDLRSHPVSLQPGWLTVAGLLYVLGVFPCACFYHLVLRRFGQSPGWLETVRAFYVSHLGKYVPGKAWSVALRAGLIHGDAVGVVPATVGTFVEVLSMIGSGSTFAALILAPRWPEYWTLTLTATGVALASIAVISPPLLNFSTRLILKRRAQGETVELPWRHRWSTLAIGWLAMVPVWLLLGLSLGATLRGLGASVALPGDLLRLVGAVCLAACLGFASLLPAGAGVRELLLLEMLEPHYGAGPAAAAAVALRLTWISSEVAASVILYTMVRGRRWGQ